MRRRHETQHTCNTTRATRHSVNPLMSNLISSVCPIALPYQQQRKVITVTKHDRGRPVEVQYKYNPLNEQKYPVPYLVDECYSCD